MTRDECVCVYVFDEFDMKYQEIYLFYVVHMSDLFDALLRTLASPCVLVHNL